MGKRPKDMCPFMYWRKRQEREIQNAQPGVVSVIKVRRQKDICMGKIRKASVLLTIGVLSMSSKSGNKRTYVWAKAKETCILLAIGEQERDI